MGREVQVEIMYISSIGMGRSSSEDWNVKAEVGIRQDCQY